MRYTLADIEALPEGVRAELLDGELYYLEQPGTLHQEIVGSLLFELYDYIKELNMR